MTATNQQDQDTPQVILNKTKGSGLFDDFADVKVHEQRQYIDDPCEVVCIITNAFAGKSVKPKTKGTKYVVFEFEVTECKSGPYHKGDTLSMYRAIVGDHNVSDIRRCVAAALHERERDCTPLFVAAAFDHEEGGACVMVGESVRIVGVHTPSGKTDAKGNVYVNLKFHRVDAVQEAANAEAIDF